jgi:hypothetical protein
MGASQPASSVKAQARLKSRPSLRKSGQSAIGDKKANDNHGNIAAARCAEHRLLVNALQASAFCAASIPSALVGATPRGDKFGCQCHTASSPVALY